MSQRVIAVIPARGGSKGIPGKNLAKVGGVPLIQRAVMAAQRSVEIDDVFVSTDSADIADAAAEAGASVIPRPSEIAGDTASSEEALLHALRFFHEKGMAADVLVFIQATSPFIVPEDLSAAIVRVLSGEEDVVFSATETYAFLWKQEAEGAVGVNHDHSWRPRRQDRSPHYQESGAFYVMRAEGFREHKFRFFGRVGIQVARNELSGYEIDEPFELEVARELARTFDRPYASVDVDALIMDFDGVHTDDLLSVDQEGRESVVVSRSDGMGIELLKKNSLPMLIISKEQNAVVTARGRKLGIEVRQGIEDKAHVLRSWAEEKKIPLDRIAYVGNDINDEECLRLVGWPVIVPNASQEIEKYARVRLRTPGGRGAIRELANLILASRKERND